MNNFGRGNWFLMFGIFAIGAMMFVLASPPNWNGASSVNYTTVEDSSYYHNLSANITGFNDDISFSIDTDPSNKISWTNSTGAAILVFPSDISDWFSIVDSSSGNLTINATHDNQTGFFVVPIQAINTTDSEGSITDFEFIINATNDAPNFTSSGIANNFSFLANSSMQNFTLIATDEENHFPLTFNVSFNITNCTHGSRTGYNDNENCSLFDFGMNLTSSGNETAVISFTPNSTYIGTYWANISVMDAVENYNCPHAYCDSTYNTTNLTTYHSEMVKFVVYPALEADVSNCTGAVLMEDEAFNCTIIVTTPVENDNLTLSSNASLRTITTPPTYNSSWFLLDDYSPTASNYNHNVTVLVTPTKSEVGNLTINFTVDNGEDSPVSELIYIYVNYTESNVSLDTISNRTLYENYNLSVVAVDKDLLVLDTSVKNESLIFASNTSWVNYSSKETLSGANYSTAIFDVDYDYVLANNGTGNYSILINVTDLVGNTDSQVFVIEILNETAPEWDPALSDPVSLVLTEGTLFTYNVSAYVSDAEGDSINFTYTNVSGEFCSLNSTNFNTTSGIINFIPVDCDVGYHNVSIIATDGKINSTVREFNFTINNIADNPVINKLYINGTAVLQGQNRSISESAFSEFILEIDDDDFAIPSAQKSIFYNESLTVDVISTNSSGSEVDLFEFYFKEASGISDSRVIYNGSFTPTGAQVGNYTIFVNITDFSGTSINRTFYLNVTAVSDLPSIVSIDNQSVTVYDYLNFTVNATDEEDDRLGLNLNFSIENLTVGAPVLIIGNESGIVNFNMSSNFSHVGSWEYNVSVMDSDSQYNSTTFWLFVYGNITLLSPAEGVVFNLTENITDVLNFTMNHSVGDNLTYEFWIDSISCLYNDSSNCTYGNLSLRETVNSSGNGSIYGWSFTPNYLDETYDNYKNITVVVYPATGSLNETQKDAVATNFSFKLDINHTNAPVRLTGVGIGKQQADYNSNIEIDLSDYFVDEDVDDEYYSQNITVTVTGDSRVGSLASAWALTLSNIPKTAFTTYLEFSVNDSINESSIDNIEIEFTAPAVETVTSPSGSNTKIKHYALKLIVPQDVVISEKGFIDIPFAVQNNGQIDLRGISLDSFVKFNDIFNNDITISLEEDYIQELGSGESQNFSMRIVTNVHRVGKYKATILANVSSPKFSDFADFFIEIKEANQSEADQILIFTEKFIADNPECLELTELLKQAEEAFSLGEYSNSIKIAREVTEACEDAIEANEQIRYKVEGFVQDNFFYISFATLVVFFMGFIFYIYKRVRFNKSEMNEYI